MVSFRNVVGDCGEGDIGGNAVAARGRTVPAMSSRPRRLDRRTLVPREYLVDPFQFGRTPAPTWVLPEAGDTVSQRVAMVQHQLAVAIRNRHRRSTTRTVTRAFGFSKQYWSLCLLGKAWMGETLLAAAVSVVLVDRDPHHVPPPGDRYP